MRRLLSFVLIMMLSLVVSVRLAVFVGGQRPIPKRLALLHLADCQLPCWIGIVPGATTQEEARQKVRGVYGNNALAEWDPSENITFSIWDEHAPNHIVRIYFVTWETKPGVITSINFSLSGVAEDQISLGDLYTLLGPPVSITPVDKGYSDFNYGRKKCCATFSIFALDRFEYTQILEGFALYSPSVAPGALPEIEPRPWRGFTTLERYMGYPEP